MNMNKPCQDFLAEIRKAAPGKIAAAAAAVVLLSAALVGIVMAGLSTPALAPETEVPAETEMVYTIPQDGNPEDETAKGSYTASDAAVQAAADQVVATIGEYTLTNGQLQVYYWMEVQNFLSNYGSYAMYFGLDVSQRLDTQVCGISENGETWQQFFLNGALNTWMNHQSLAAEAQKAGYQMDEVYQAELDNLPETMEQNALSYGMANAQELLAYNVGGGASMEDYLHFMNLYYPGTLYFNEQVEAYQPTDEEVEAYFTQNEQSYTESGLTRDAKTVDIRHVLIMPQGADSANIRTETFDEAAWETSRVQAEELLAQWEQGDKSEESFAALAVEHSQDGSAVDGGLYTKVTQGQMVEAFDSWCFDAARQVGDYGLVETEFGYHLMYFVGSNPLWPQYAREDLMNARASDMMTAILEQYTLEADYEKMLIAYVDIDGDSSNDVSAEAAEPVEAEPMPVLVIAGVSIAALLVVAVVLKQKEHE